MPKDVERITRKALLKGEMPESWTVRTYVQNDRLYVEGCKMCDMIRDEDRGFGPPHFARDTCESGKHNHCTCDTCF